MIELLNVDCMEYMAGLEDNAFELAIVDPPYGIGISSNPVRQQHAKKQWDNEIPKEDYFVELMRVSQSQIIWHPTQKPVKLYDWLLSNYAKEGDRILDTHLGSGSSAIAAHYGGFDFVGCELDEDYYKAAVNRFHESTKQVALF